MRARRKLLTVVALLAALHVTGAATFVSADAGSGEAVFVAAQTPPDTSDDEGEDSADAEEDQEDEKAEPTSDHDCGDTGDYQEEVEEYLDELGGYGEVFVDGEQSEEDCEAIEKFQKRMGIQPAEGIAGELTADVAERLVNSDLEKCDSGDDIVVCVDLTNQTLWVTEFGEIVAEPTVVRTGMSGYATTAGKWDIFDRADTHWSRPYKVWLPYWQNFNNGQGLHETTSYIHEPALGSHGCVNLLPDDAKELYELLDNGDTLHIFGKRPGT